jgi:hypothetical protein
MKRENMISKKRKNQLQNMSIEEIENTEFTSEEKRFIQYNSIGTNVLGTIKIPIDEENESTKKLLKLMLEFGDISQYEYDKEISKINNKNSNSKQNL